METTTTPPLPRALLALPAAGCSLLSLGAATAAAGGAPPVVLVGAAAVITVGTCALAEARAAPAIVLLAWMTAVAFARPPFGALQPTAPGSASAALTVVLAAGAGIGIRVGGIASLQQRTLVGVTRLSGLVAAVDPRRRLLGVALAAAALPALTAGLTPLRARLSLADDLLLYLLAVVVVTVVGGFWPAIAASVGASLLLNFYFTEPYHTFTIARPDNLLAVLLFAVVAVAVSGIVHVAARQAQQARRSRAESEALLRLARTVLSGEDTPAAVLSSLRTTAGVGAELLERSGDTWVTIAAAGPLGGSPSHRIWIRDDLALVVHRPDHPRRDKRGADVDADERLLDAAAWQSAAALDRDRLRTQAAQAQALAAGNRMRTALLAAVSHDLRTPLASIKAGISSLRQQDVVWSREDEAELYSTIEESADRLHALIANLLDMSRVQTGAVQPCLRRAALDEIVPAALHDVDREVPATLDVSEHLPLVLTDAGLVERALANLVSNAARYNGTRRPVAVLGWQEGNEVVVDVVDHGPGVPLGDRERMFEPFQRLGDTSPATGVGLGLAVARGFIDAVGGRLDALDTPGGGLTMRIHLPAASSSAAAEPALVEPRTR